MYSENNRFPAEWEPQSGVMMTWPHAETDWNYMLQEVEECYVEMAKTIARYEPLLIVTPHAEELRERLTKRMPLDNVKFFACDTNDTWARDHGFLTIQEKGEWKLLDFCFNGWGEKFEAAKDNAINAQLYANGYLQGEYENHLDFVFEGGSIESDGKGTLLTTSSCLLASHRNDMTKEEIDKYLCDKLHADRVLWLTSGALEGDDTDGHIDTLARLCENNTIAYEDCADENDSHFVGLQAMRDQLKEFRNKEGEPYRLLPLPLPDAIYEEGERLPATYANFLVINGAVLMPTYDQKEKDALALMAMRIAFPGRDVIGIDCRALIKQHGSLHCSTMQFPEGVVKK